MADFLENIVHKLSKETDAQYTMGTFGANMAPVML
jgi:hypothetical protein